MAIRTRSVVDVQCDLCQASQTVEDSGDKAFLDTLGYRRLKISIEPIAEKLKSDVSIKREVVACTECIRKLLGSIGMRSVEDEAELRLQELKAELKVPTG